MKVYCLWVYMYITMYNSGINNLLISNQKASVRYCKTLEIFLFYVFIYPKFKKQLFLINKKIIMQEAKYRNYIYSYF